MNARTLVFAIAAVILLVGFLFFFTWRNRSANTSRAPSAGLVAKEQTFDTWSDYIDTGLGDVESSTRVVFVGIDGASWNIIDPLIKKGLMPTMERLKQRGSWGVLTSVDCYVSPPAWVSMMTGYLPERSGIYTFGVWDENRREFLDLDSRDVMVPSIWDAASFLRRTTAVCNVPVTYPVRDVNGIMISGLLTPSSLEERKVRQLDFAPLSNDRRDLPASFSPVLRTTFDYTATSFEVFLLDGTDDGETQYDRVVLDVGSAGARDATEPFRIGEYSEWVKLVHERDGKRQDAWCKVLFYPTDYPGTYLAATSRVLFDADDTDVGFTSPAELQNELASRFGRYFPSASMDRPIVPSMTDDHIRYAEHLYDLNDWDLFLYVFTQPDNIQHIDGISEVTQQVYERLDGYLARLVDNLPDDAVLILASDHGFKQYEYVIDLNRLFEQMDLLVYKDDRQIDYDRTLVFHNLWNVYFNDALLTERELARRGIAMLTGRSPRESLLTYLDKAKPTFQIPEGSQMISVEMHPIARDAVGDAPDMVVRGTYGNYMVEFWNINRPGDQVIRRLKRDESWNHTREGIFLFYGNGVKAGFNAPDENIQSIAPTILYLLDIPTAGDMDGRVIQSVFERRRLAGVAQKVVTDYSGIYTATSTDEQREALEKKLRALGYIR